MHKCRTQWEQGEQNISLWVEDIKVTEIVNKLIPPHLPFIFNRKNETIMKSVQNNLSYFLHRLQQKVLHSAADCCPLCRPLSHLRKLQGALRSPLSLLLSKADKCRVLSSSSEGMSCGSFSSFGALLGIGSCTLTYFLSGEAKNHIECQGAPLVTSLILCNSLSPTPQPALHPVHHLLVHLTLGQLVQRMLGGTVSKSRKTCIP